jgi:hypothetical protein
MVATFPAPCPEQTGGLGKKNKIPEAHGLDEIVKWEMMLPVFIKHSV